MSIDDQSTADAAKESLRLIRRIEDVVEGESIDIAQSALLFLAVNATFTEFGVDLSELQDGEIIDAMGGCLVLLRNRAAKLIANRN